MVEPTIAAEYSLGNPAQNLRAYAWSKHKDTAHMNDPIETVAFVDGFGRSEAVKREVDIEVDGTSSPVHDVRR